MKRPISIPILQIHPYVQYIQQTGYMFTLQNCDANPITTSHLGNNHYSNVIFPSPLIHLPAKSWLTLENNVPWCSRKSIEICHTKLEPLSHEDLQMNLARARSLSTVGTRGM